MKCEVGHCTNQHCMRIEPLRSTFSGHNSHNFISQDCCLQIKATLKHKESGRLLSSDSCTEQWVLTGGVLDVLRSETKFKEKH